jgi:hypothetical protein
MAPLSWHATSRLEPLLVVHIEELERTRELDPCLVEDRKEVLAKCLELIMRSPDLAHLQLTFWSKADVVLKPVGRPMPCGVEATLDLLILVTSQRLGRKPDQHAHSDILS